MINDDIGVINKLVRTYSFNAFHTTVFNVLDQFGPLTSQDCPKFEFEVPKLIPIPNLGPKKSFDSVYGVMHKLWVNLGQS